RPPNDDFRTRIALKQDTNTILFSLSGASREPEEPEGPLHTPGHTIWWSWTTTRSAFVTIETQPADLQGLISVWQTISLGGLQWVTSGVQRCEFLAQTNTLYSISLERQSESTSQGVLRLVLNEMAISSPQPNQV